MTSKEPLSRGPSSDLSGDNVGAGPAEDGSVRKVAKRNPFTGRVRYAEPGFLPSALRRAARSA